MRLWAFLESKDVGSDLALVLMLVEVRSAQLQLPLSARCCLAHA